MKTLTLYIAIAITSISFIACNSNTSNTQKGKEDSSAISSTDNPLNGSTIEIVNSYLQLKNALTQDNDKDAAAAAGELVSAFAKFDRTSLSADQSKVYTDIESDAKEHAEHIGANVGNIVHQREHFETLSKDIYDLVKNFGSGQKLYYDHCPMYNNNKGGNWLSETKEISNPYLGKAMPDCGTVKEELNL